MRLGESSLNLSWWTIPLTIKTAELTSRVQEVEDPEKTGVQKYYSNEEEKYNLDRISLRKVF